MINFLENDLLNTTELADLVVEQSNVGSTIKVADSAEVYGFISVINMHQHHVSSLLAFFSCLCNLQEFKNKESVQQIWKYLMNKIPNATLQEQFRSLMEDSTHPLGLILNERMVNVPYELAPHLHHTLFDEIAMAHQEEVRASFVSSFFLFIFLSLSAFFQYPLIPDGFHYDHKRGTPDTIILKTTCSSQICTARAAQVCVVFWLC